MLEVLNMESADFKVGGILQLMCVLTTVACSVGSYLW